MLRQILKDMYIDPELLSELSEEQKHVLFIKMREEQIRRWKEWEAELEKTNVESIPKKKSKNKKDTSLHYLIASDGNPWVWVLGESDEDASEDEKEKSFEALEDKEAERKAKEIAEKESAELRRNEMAAIELRAKKLKVEQQKIEKDRAEKERLLKEKEKRVEQTKQPRFKKFVIALDENEQNELKNKDNEKKQKEEADRKLAEMKERNRKEEEQRKENERKENERKQKEEAEKKRNEELRKKKERDEQEENKRRELAQNEAEQKRIQELKKVKDKEEEEKSAKERELQEKQEQRTREIYEKIKQQKMEERRRDEELRKKDHEAWIEREIRAKEAEFQRRSSVSEARREVKRREEEVKELQKQGFIEVASGLYRRFSQSKSKVHRVNLQQTESMKKQRPTISSPALISATGVAMSVISIKPPKPERSPPSIPRRLSRLGPAPPPPVSNGNAVVQKRTARPNNRQQIIEWWQEIELAKGSGFDNNDVFPWFHGIITRQEAESLLEDKHVGSFLVRVSERVWGYTISYRAVDRCKHFLIDTSDNSYQFFGHNQIAHASLEDLVKFHQSKPVSGIGGELLLKSCGQKKGSEPDYKELVSQTTMI